MSTYKCNRCEKIFDKYEARTLGTSHSALYS